MEKLILRDFDFFVDEGELLSAVNIDKDDDPDLACEAVEVIREGFRIPAPRQFAPVFPLK